MIPLFISVSSSWSSLVDIILIYPVYVSLKTDIISTRCMKRKTNKCWVQSMTWCTHCFVLPLSCRKRYLKLQHIYIFWEHKCPYKYYVQFTTPKAGNCMTVYIWIINCNMLVAQEKRYHLDRELNLRWLFISIFCKVTLRLNVVFSYNMILGHPPRSLDMSS